MGFEAWNAFNALFDLHEDMIELERIAGQRIIRRMLRDMMDPFECPEKAFCSFFRVSRQLGRDLCGWLRPFLERERSHGLTVETKICDPNFKILAVNARYGGRAHDTFVWHGSQVREQLRQRYETGERNFWLLGDSGYPLEPWLLTPIPDAEPGSPEYLYTEAHCKARSIIERCNAVLKNSWGCLSKKRVLYYNPVTAGYITYACCVLHNLRILYEIEDEDYDSDDVEDDVSVGSEADPLDEDNVAEGNEDGGADGEEEGDENSDSEMSVSEEESTEEGTDEGEEQQGEEFDDREGNVVGVLNVLDEARAIQNAVIEHFAQR